MPITPIDLNNGDAPMNDYQTTQVTKSKKIADVCDIYRKFFENPRQQKQPSNFNF